ncbi:2OG-Fe(II) oxygenase family protein [Embleya sp. NPDC001921]
MSVISHCADDLVEQGYAVLRIAPRQASALAAALERSRAFFRRPHAEKLQHGSEDRNYGYRPMGVEYSVSPERPDCNECFTLWHRTNRIPRVTDLGPLIEALLAWRAVCAEIATRVLDACGERFRGVPPAFAAASHLQVNSCLPAPAGRDLLQDPHEDGHLITVHHATGPGLEVAAGGLMRPITQAPDELLVMPGSILTALTGGAIRPLYHQVRNLRLHERRSLMYFVNPELDTPLPVWLPVGDRRDLRDTVRSNPLAFGLPPVREL